METAPTHKTAAELKTALDDILAAPKDESVLRAIVVRPESNQRRVVQSAELSPEGGIAGDRWATDHWKRLPDGSSDPEGQVSLMSSRVLLLLAGGDDWMPLAGDNLIVDLDLSEQNLPTGTRLAIGSDVVLEMTSEPHTGCKKFRHRYGKPALEFVNGEVGSAHNFRGRFAKVIQRGTITSGDMVQKV